MSPASTLRIVGGTSSCSHSRLGDAVTVLLVEVGSDPPANDGASASGHALSGIYLETVAASVDVNGGVEVPSKTGGFMASFANLRGAVQCALEVQQAIDTRMREHSRLSPRLRMKLWMGMQMDEVIRCAGASARPLGNPLDGAIPDEATADASVGPHVFRREGEYWTLRYGQRLTRLRDAKGMHYLAHLLRHPHQEFHALDLASGSSPRPLADSGLESADPVLDAKARSAYRHRLADLRDELEEAEQCNDVGRTAKARTELDFLATHLAAAIGLQGRHRNTASNVERARVAVRMRIGAVVGKIRTNLPPLGDHLATSVRTGYFCAYRPDSARPVKWTF